MDYFYSLLLLQRVKQCSEQFGFRERNFQTIESKAFLSESIVKMADQCAQLDKLAILIVASILIGCAQALAKDKDYCSLSEDHIACKNNGVSRIEFIR